MTCKFYNPLVILIIVVFFFTTICLPGCEKAFDLKEPGADAVSVFDDTWKTLDERYVFFGFKNIDWDSVYNVYRPQVTANMSNDVLFSVVDNMLQTLRDGHVSLSTPAKSSAYAGFYQLYLMNFNYGNIINNYLNNDYQITGSIIYKISDGVGYIYYPSFENDITNAEVDSVVSAMSGTKGLIIDVRNNTGGNTENADKLYQRFISGKTLVKYEKQKNGKGHNDFFNPTALYLPSQGVYYNKPICVLTNRRCYSACNDFVMYMSKLPNVTLIGDNTGGGGGIPVDYLLANGWKLQYTATATLTPDKSYIENGIVPDISINITPVDETNGKDPILDKAIQILQ